MQVFPRVSQCEMPPRQPRRQQQRQTACDVCADAEYTGEMEYLLSNMISK